MLCAALCMERGQCKGETRLLQPYSVVTKLEKHQEDFVEFAYKLEQEDGLTGGILLDEMGMGKTLQLLSHFVRVRQGFEEQGLLKYTASAEQHRRMLVVCPKNAIGTWLEEIQRHTHGLSAMHFKSRKGTDAVKKLESADIVIVNYGLLAMEYRDRSESSPLYNYWWYRVVLDESHTVRNHETLMWRAVCELKANSTKRWLCTGTPIQNCVRDMFTGFMFIDAEGIDCYENWKDKSDEELFITAKALNERLALRRKHSKMPPKHIFRLTTPFMHQKEQELYDKTYKGILQYVDLYEECTDDEARESIYQHVLERFTRLRQLCVLPRLAYPTTLARKRWAGPCCTKMRMLREYLQEKLGDDEKVLVFSNFIGVLDEAERLVQELGMRFVRIDGSCSVSARRQSIAEFKAHDPNGGVRVFLLSTHAAKEGINLAEANRVVFLDSSFNPQVENQAADRVYRMGQTKPVYITYFAIGGTIERNIMQRRAGKQKIADCVLDSEKSILDALESFKVVKKSLMSSKETRLNTRSVTAIRQIIHSSHMPHTQNIDDECEFRTKARTVLDTRGYVEGQNERGVVRDVAETRMWFNRKKRSRPYGLGRAENGGCEEVEELYVAKKSREEEIPCTYADMKRSVEDTRMVVAGTLVYSCDWFSRLMSNDCPCKIYLNPLEAIHDLITSLSVSAMNFEAKISARMSEVMKKYEKIKQKKESLAQSLQDEVVIGASDENLKELQKRYNKAKDDYDLVTRRISEVKIPDFYSELSCVLYCYQFNQDVALKDNMLGECQGDDGFVMFDNYTLHESVLYQEHYQELPFPFSRQFKLWTHDNYLDRFQESIDDKPLIPKHCPDPLTVLSMFGTHNPTIDNQGRICKFTCRSQHNELVHLWTYTNNTAEFFVFVGNENTVKWIQQIASSFSHCSILAPRGTFEFTSCNTYNIHITYL